MVLNAMSVALGFVLSTGALQTTTPPIKDPVGELESRRVTAERSAKEIRTKGAELGQPVREAYEAAVKTHNAWLDGVCQRMEGGKGTDDALDALAKTAGDAYTAWYIARARALGQPAHPSTASILDIYNVRLFNASAAVMLGKQEREASVRSAESRQRLTWKVWEQVGGDYPAVTIARAFTGTFAGIRPVDVPAFIAAQAAAAAAATLLCRWLVPTLAVTAKDVTVPRSTSPEPALIARESQPGIEKARRLT